MVEIGLGLDRCEVAKFSSTLSESSCSSAVGSLLCLVQFRSEEAYIRRKGYLSRATCLFWGTNRPCGTEPFDVI